RGRKVLVFVIHVKAAALCIDGVALGPAFKCQLFFLVQETESGLRFTSSASTLEQTSQSRLPFALIAQVIEYTSHEAFQRRAITRSRPNTCVARGNGIITNKGGDL